MILKYKYLSDLYNRYSNAPDYFYGMLFVQSDMHEDDFRDLVKRVYDLCDKYAELSFLFVLSTHKSDKELRKIKIYTGKPGRPKTATKGNIAVKHCHGLIISKSEDGKAFESLKEDLRTYCRKRRKKYSHLKRQRITNAWEDGLPIIDYMLKQADKKRKHGNFDFYYFDGKYREAYSYFGEYGKCESE